MVIDSQIFDYFKKLVDQDKDAIIDQIETEEEVKWEIDDENGIIRGENWINAYRKLYNYVS
jgi:hypothetical protein